MTNPGLELTSSLQSIVEGAAQQPARAIDDALACIKEVDPQIHAWTYVESAEVLQCAGPALAIDQPLAGVPFAVKDVIDVAGMPTLCGSPAEPIVSRAFDASCVSLLRQAGAIPIGKVVTAEYAFRRPGPTQNPRAPGHTPGGSSSGSAAVVAAGMTPFALGTQTGGSIIRPAAYCGVVGFKPSFGGVFRDGLRMTCESLDVIGWHTRSVIDSELLAGVLLPYKAPAKTHAERPKKIAVVWGDDNQGLEMPSRQALQRAKAIFGQQGIECIDIAFEEGKNVAEIHSTVMHYEFARSLYPVVLRCPDQLSHAIHETVQKGFAISVDDYLAKRHAQATWRYAWDKLFGDADLILTPSTPGTALQGMSHTGSSSFNRIWSALGWPCLHLPTGLSDMGLPIGVQVVGRYEADRSLLAWARVLHGDLLARKNDLHDLDQAA